MKNIRFLLSPCYLLINLYPMFTLKYLKSRDNLSSSDVTLSSRISSKIYYLRVWIAASQQHKVDNQPALSI